MKKVKVGIDEEEWYPVYELTNSDYCDFEIEVTEKEAKWLREVFNEFEKAQQFIRKKLSEQEKYEY